MSKVSSTTVDKQSFFLTILKGALIALSVSLVLILIFAFILRFLPIADAVISPVNQIIKGISVLIGALFAMKKCQEMGLITGAFDWTFLHCFSICYFFHFGWRI